jgi:hypothetical protein
MDVTAIHIPRTCNKHLVARLGDAAFAGVAAIDDAKNEIFSLFQAIKRMSVEQGGSLKIERTESCSHLAQI